MELIPEPGHLVTLQIVDHTCELSISTSSHRDVVNRVDKLRNTRSCRREEISFKAMKAYIHLLCRKKFSIRKVLQYLMVDEDCLQFALLLILSHLLPPPAEIILRLA